MFAIRRRHFSRFAKVLYRSPVALFSLLNGNAVFHQLMKARFSDVPVYVERFMLYEEVHSTISGQAIDYLEFGVWKGGSIRKWTEMNQNANSRFFGFDCFEGLPEDWNSSNAKGGFDVQGNIPQIDDARLAFVKGLFQETLYHFLESYQRPEGSRIVLHMDADLYSSTLFVLAALDRYLQPGDIVIFDEFSSIISEFQAFVDYDRSFYRSWEALGYAGYYTQAAIRITK